MEWTVRFYSYMADQWRRRRDADGALSEGHRAYASEKIAMWNSLKDAADGMFSKANRNHRMRWTTVD